MRQDRARTWIGRLCAAWAAKRRRSRVKAAARAARLSVLLLCALAGSGCLLTGIGNAHLTRHTHTQRALRMQPQPSGSGIEVGVDVFSLGAVWDYPLTHTGLMIGDYLLIRTATRYAQRAGWIDGGSDDDRTPRGTIVIQGDGNMVNYVADGASSSQPWQQGSGSGSIRGGE
jgi:hypothetical protein